MEKTNIRIMRKINNNTGKREGREDEKEDGSVKGRE
jgi:hypothetical protein